jgi:hypothetical protein
MESSVAKWIRVGLVNLTIVAFLGSVLRYKIAFSLPFIQQKYLLHGHSHFAFSGWVTQILMLLILVDLSKSLGLDLVKKYKNILYSNLIFAYGMLIAFPLQGYGFYSICFSTLSIFVFYWFAYVIFKEIRKSKLTRISFYWYKTSLLLAILSSIGAFALAFFMATLNKNQNAYLLSVYGYLHFQYNGWFFFSLMGLITNKMEAYISSKIIFKRIFWMFTLAILPSYFLSALWLEMPNWIYYIIVISAILQTWGLFNFIKTITAQKQHFSIRSNVGNILFLLALIALCIKVLLQLFSTIPLLSQIAFGYRSIVIGYLHLMLLGVISLSIIGCLLHDHLMDINSLQKKGLWFFVGGVIINQFLLMLQGLAGMLYIFIPFVNESLFGAALVMFSGLFVFNFTRERRELSININK